MIACRRCGEGDMLFPDPAGYCNDAESENGASLLCRWCRDPKHPAIIAAAKEKQEKLKELKMTRFEAFLWILMRDYVPVGIVAEIIKDLGEFTKFVPVPDNKNMAELCKDYTARILG